MDACILQTGLFYVPVINLCGTFKRIRQDFEEGMAYRCCEASVAGKPQSGEVKAFDRRPSCSRCRTGDASLHRDPGQSHQATPACPILAAWIHPRPTR
jgi:hypothetical protein